MTPLDGVLLFAAALAAGTVNTVVGAGSLITFPTLVALGYSPLVANVTNTVGLVPGGVSGSLGYRAELSGQARRTWRLAALSAAGGLCGAVLLLVLPAAAFAKVVPFLLLVACALVVAQPWLARRLASASLDDQRPRHALTMGAAVCASGIYGGYFGAAQGVILIAVLGIFLGDHLQRLNAVKNVCVAAVNAVAALLFVVFGPVAWLPALLVALGAVIGGWVGATVGRRLPPNVLRVLIVVVGGGVAIKLLLAW